MTEAKKQDAQATIGDLFQGLMSLLASPIRGFYLAVGHAQVASFALVSIATVFVGYWWTEMIRDINEPINIARASEIDASIRERELRIREKELDMQLSAGELTWRLGEMRMDLDTATIDVEYPPLVGASKMLLQWRDRSRQTGGLLTQPIIIDSSGVTTTSFPFPLQWEPGRDYVISLEQELDTGQRVRFIQSGRVLSLPSTGQ